MISNIHFVGIWTKHDENAYSDDAMGEMSSNDQDTGATGDSKNTSIGSPTYCEENRIKPLCEMNVAEICKWLTDVKECTKLNFDVDSFLTNEIDGEAFVSLTIDELKELIPALGTRKKLIMERDKIASSVIPRSTYLYDIKKTPTDIKLSEILRKFDNEVGINIEKVQSLTSNQSRVKNLIDPVHRFILPKNAEEEEILNCFLTETVKFGAACMNERTNGTIHFGIVGSTENEDNYNAGKIVGIHVNKISFQNQYFFPDQQSKALSCIRPAKFIEVTTSVGKSDILHVIEVDVVPSFRIINGESFFLKLLDGNEKDSCRFYRYSENGPALQNHKNIAEYMKECHTLSENRKDAEDHDFLCCGCDRIESDIYPLLFINSPDTNMGMQTELEPFAFLKDIPFRAIFDFAQNREKSIMYKYLNEDLKQKKFDIDRVDKKQMKETFDGLKESSVPSWVFCSSDMA
ncbi:LOW QUALITY PROTEIN: hypothetical protein KUTeg_009550 [Tegillarca granosa]|uniref:SAM domain-containing protein n=1 Tax=Tegillarca granosa TaxID=220873 RepID=A0ABQ9F8I7_TEGGR|nr:LOW QUALITY PROTEIN: hypothetical protein KUTeg_009550 [Tegillarca granosa]